MFISIVIPAYNEEKYLADTLRSVCALDTGRHTIEILLIDGGSTDQTIPIAKRYGARIVTERRRGIGLARERGLEESRGEIVLFTDADTIVPTKWLLAHVDGLSEPQAIMSFGGIWIRDGYFPYYHAINYYWRAHVFVMYYGLSVPLANGQNIGCWRKKTLDAGGFGKGVDFAEDIDFALRMRKYGRVVYLPRLVVSSSGRRSEEGWHFLYRSFRTACGIIAGRRNFAASPDFR